MFFSPLGLNNFITESLSEVAPNQLNLEFDYFRETMNPVLDLVYDTDNIDNKVDLLDQYFLSVYVGFQNDTLETAIRIILNTNNKISVNELSEKLKVSRKTLLRLFRKHQNCTVQDYIKLIRFRKAIDIFQKTSQKTSFTELALRADYYDQSDFINHFKKLSGFNPKSFFKNLQHVGDQDTFWTFD